MSNDINRPTEDETFRRMEARSALEAYVRAQPPLTAQDRDWWQLERREPLSGLQVIVNRWHVSLDYVKSRLRLIENLLQLREGAY